LQVDLIAGVEPGHYGTNVPTLEHHELLLVATRPHFPIRGETL